MTSLHNLLLSARMKSFSSSQVADAGEPDERVGDADDGEGAPEAAAAERRPHARQLRGHVADRRLRIN